MAHRASPIAQLVKKKKKKKKSAYNAGDPGLIPKSAKSKIRWRRDKLLEHSWASLAAQLVKNPPAM